MTKSILLLVERRKSGKGPDIPVRHKLTRFVATGLSGPDRAVIRVGEYSMTISNGAFEPEFPVEPGQIMFAEIIGDNSIATIWAE